MVMRRMLFIAAMAAWGDDHVETHVILEVDRSGC